MRKRSLRIEHDRFCVSRDRLLEITRTCIPRRLPPEGIDGELLLPARFGIGLLSTKSLELRLSFRGPANAHEYGPERIARFAQVFVEHQRASERSDRLG